MCKGCLASVPEGTESRLGRHRVSFVFLLPFTHKYIISA